MRPRTILSYANGSPEDDERLRAAVDCARATGAMLLVLCVSYTSRAANFGTDAKERLAAHEGARRLAQTITENMDVQGVCVDVLPFVTLPEAFDHHFEGIARYADVVVKHGASSTNTHFAGPLPHGSEAA